MANCSQCKAQIDAEAAYCSKCGAQITTSQADAAWIAGMQEEIKQVTTGENTGGSIFFLSLVLIALSIIFSDILENLSQIFLVIGVIGAIVGLVVVIICGTKKSQLTDQLKRGQKNSR